MAKVKPKTIIWEDERNDDFSGISKNTMKIDSTFPFLHKNIFWNAAAFVVYRIIMTPFAYLYCKLKYKVKYHNRKAFDCCRKQGFFLYRNHTLTDADAFIPPIAVFPTRNYTVVNADNLSTPGTKNYIQMCGAIPVPQDIKAYGKFMSAIEKHILKKQSVTIYPEAHIWPYYTKIRNFPDTSFSYPIKFDSPVFCATTTFSPPTGHSAIPRVDVYIDGPFYPADYIAKAGRRGAAKLLRDDIHKTMCSRAEEHSTYEAIKYIRKGDAETND